MESGAQKAPVPTDEELVRRFQQTGTEIAREMKELKPEVPILIMSAAMEKPNGLQFADGFLAKGESPTVLSFLTSWPVWMLWRLFLFPEMSGARRLPA